MGCEPSSTYSIDIIRMMWTWKALQYKALCSCRGGDDMKQAQHHLLHCSSLWERYKTPMERVRERPCTELASCDFQSHKEKVLQRNNPWHPLHRSRWWWVNFPTHIRPLPHMLSWPPTLHARSMEMDGLTQNSGRKLIKGVFNQYFYIYFFKRVTFIEFNGNTNLRGGWL